MRQVQILHPSAETKPLGSWLTRALAPFLSRPHANPVHIFPAAARRLARTPFFTTLVVFVLALGLGSNTAIFSVMDAVLLRPLPYFDSARLVHVTSRDGNQSNLNGCLSFAHYQFFSNHNSTVSGLAGYTGDSFNLSRSGVVTQIPGARVSANFFSVLGVTPAIGRSFRANEEAASGNVVAIISHDMWQRRFSGQPDILERHLDLDSKSYLVVGVLPPGFRFGALGENPEVWVTSLGEMSMMTPQQVQAGSCYINAVGRLTPQSSYGSALANFSVLQQQFLRDYSKLGDADSKRVIEIIPLREKIVGHYRYTFFTLLATVILLLLIGCANVGGLLLARTVDRRKEIAVRIALGATPYHVVSQLLAETLWLSGLAGLFGILLSIAATHLLKAQLTKLLPSMGGSTASIDWRILTFAASLSVFTAILCSLAPCLQFANPKLNAVLREQGRGSAGGRHRHLARSLLVVAQISLSVLLLVNAGLLLHSFMLLSTQQTGFEPRGVLSMTVSLPQNGNASPEQIVSFYNRVISRVDAVPEVQSSAIASSLPANESRLSHFLAEGQPVYPLAERPLAAFQSLTASYLHLMKIPLVRGRFFTNVDKYDSLRVAVINRTFAQHFFPGQDPIGKHVWMGRNATPWQIVGIIGDIRNVSLSSPPQAEIEIPFPQLPLAQMSLLARGRGDAAALRNDIRAAFSQSGMPAIADVMTLDEILADARAQPRALTVLLTIFALLALVLATVGLYSVITYSTSQRTQEFGVRLALGATRAALIQLVIRQAAILAAAGIAVGVVLSFAFTRLLSGFVYGIHFLDPPAFAISALVFFVGALAASYVPAVRATRLKVAEALRSE